MIDTAIGGMKTRFIKEGKNPTLLVLASSKRSEKSFLETHMRQKLETEQENVKIVDEPVWIVKPKGTYKETTFRVALGNKFLQSKVIDDSESNESYIAKGYKILNIPEDFKPNFLEDIERALCDYAGISSSEISKYMSGGAVNKVVNKNLQNPFPTDILEIGNAPDDTRQYYDYFDLSKINPDMMYKPLFIHLDMSISGDKTGIAGVWIKGKKPSTNANMQSGDLYFTNAFSIAIKAPKGYQISFEKNRQFIYWLRQQGFNIKGISSDTFQSYDTGQALLAKGFNYSILSVDKVETDHICRPYQYLKSTIYEERVELLDNQLLINELTDLERNINTGKVDHPEKASKDTADAVCGAIYNASKNAELFAYEYGEMLDVVLQQGDTDTFFTKQVTLDFEEELKRAAFNNLGIANMSQVKKFNDDYDGLMIM